jgi:hypothetical protein
MQFGTMSGCKEDTTRRDAQQDRGQLDSRERMLAAPSKLCGRRRM